MVDRIDSLTRPSMKVPPKRKGNRDRNSLARSSLVPLNESPSEKEGKCYQGIGVFVIVCSPQ